MSHLAENILSAARAMPEGGLLSPKEFLHLGSRAAIDKKANHSLIYDVGKLGAFTDYFLITSGASDRQVQAICNEVERQAKDAGFGNPKIEGYDDGRWVLIDFGHVVVHVFQDAIREFYDLETLWSEAPRVKIPEDYYSGPATSGNVAHA